MSASSAQREIADFTRPPNTQARRMAFLIFHSAHPEVLRTLIKLARERIAKQKAQGREPKIGMRNLWERMRWDLDESPVIKGETRPALNNNLAPEYARFMAETFRAEFGDVFEFRGGGDE